MQNAMYMQQHIQVKITQSQTPRYGQLHILSDNAISTTKIQSNCRNAFAINRCPHLYLMQSHQNQPQRPLSPLQGHQVLPPTDPQSHAMHF